MSIYNASVDIMSEVIRRMLPQDIMSLMLTCKYISTIVKSTMHYQRISKLYLIRSDVAEVGFEISENYYSETEYMHATLRLIGGDSMLAAKKLLTIYISTHHGDLYVGYDKSRPNSLSVHSASGTRHELTVGSYADQSGFFMRRIILHLFGKFARTSGLIEFLDDFRVFVDYPNAELSRQIKLCNDMLD